MVRVNQYKLFLKKEQESDKGMLKINASQEKSKVIRPVAEELHL
jgi:hypothetical protein